VLISEVDETEIFKICLEYWNSLVSDLYRESPFVATVNPLFIGKSIELPPRRILYNPILSKVSRISSWFSQPVVSLVIGSRPSDHYFHSVCWFVCLFVCAEFFSAVFDPILIKLGHMLYVWV